MPPTVAALFVSPSGPYPSLPDVDCWDELRDARRYPGALPVVAHPPCARWSRLAESVQARLPHLRVGDDGGCFAAALNAVRSFGGVLEHPSETKAWAAFGLTRPIHTGWQPSRDGWVCEVWQSVYGHLATKRTWLYYHGNTLPVDLLWDRVEGTHVVGGDSRKRRAAINPKPRLTSVQNIHTPILFAEALISLARSARPANL